MNKITDTLIEETNSNLWVQVKSKLGSEDKASIDDTIYIGEICRGLYVLQIWQREGQPRSPESFLRSYSIQDSVIPELLEKYLGVQPIDSKKSKNRKDLWGAFIVWAKLHGSEQFTTEQLVEVSGFSYPTTLEYIKISPYFKRIKKGLYEVVEPDGQK